MRMTFASVSGVALVHPLQKLIDTRDLIVLGQYKHVLRATSDVQRISMRL